jgi:hypothetical protein
VVFELVVWAQRTLTRYATLAEALAATACVDPIDAWTIFKFDGDPVGFPHIVREGGRLVSRSASGLG